MKFNDLYNSLINESNDIRQNDARFDTFEKFIKLLKISNAEDLQQGFPGKILDYIVSEGGKAERVNVKTIDLGDEPELRSFISELDTKVLKRNYVKLDKPISLVWYVANGKVVGISIRNTTSGAGTIEAIINDSATSKLMKAAQEYVQASHDKKASADPRYTRGT